MSSKLARLRVSPAMLVALLACFIAAGGPAWAGHTLSGPKKKAINGKKIKKGTVTTKQIKDGTLLKQDFAAGVLPDLSVFFTKSQSDARYLPKGGTAADSAKVGGVGASAFTQGGGLDLSAHKQVPRDAPKTDILTIPGVGTYAAATCPSSGEQIGAAGLSNDSGTTMREHSFYPSGTGTYVDDDDVTSGELAADVDTTNTPHGRMVESIIVVGHEPNIRVLTLTVAAGDGDAASCLFAVSGHLK
jgi:hypothetical protein